MIKADPHMHSYYSDGLLSPTEVVKKQKKAGIKIIALTDHNSVKGIDEAAGAGRKLGIRVIPAVEMTGAEGEILVYFINHKNKELKNFLRRCASYELERVELLLGALKKLGNDVSLKSMEKTFPHAKNNYNLGHFKTYLRTKGWDEVQLKKIIQRKIIKLKIRKPGHKRVPFLEIVRFSSKIGGVSIMAHPWFSKKTLFNDKAMKALVSAGLKGIEFDNGDRNTWGRNASTVKRIRQCAKKYNLIVIRGTDYHAVPYMKGKGHLPGHTFCSVNVIKQLEKIKKSYC